MIWQMWVDIIVSCAVPGLTIWLYASGRIQTRHLYLMIWGFLIGSTWEFGFYIFSHQVYNLHVQLPFPKIILSLMHTFWDAGLFIIGYWLCLLILRTSDCCTRFKWAELMIMLIWGVGQEFVVELSGNGVIWEYNIQSWNPVWITICGQDYTALPQVVWMVAPVVYYLGVIRINRWFLKVSDVNQE